MAYAISRSELQAHLTFRLRDLHAGQQQQFTDLDTPISEALRWAAPLGDVSIVTMSKTQHDASPQTPDLANKVSRVLRVRVIASNGVMSGPLGPQLYRFDRSSPRWLKLTHGLGAAETLEAELLQEYDPDSPLITADTEMIVRYALHVLLERETMNGPNTYILNSEQHTATHLVEAEKRKQEQMIFLGLTPLPASTGGSKK